METAFIGMIANSIHQDQECHRLRQGILERNRQRQLFKQGINGELATGPQDRKIATLNRMFGLLAR